MTVLRRGKILYKGVLAGSLEETEEGYSFIYDENYLSRKDAQPISVTIPFSKKPFFSSTLHPFFDGLIPEGWLLSIVVKNWKVDRRDRMGLLLTVCRDCIGAVSVEAFNE